MCSPDGDILDELTMLVNNLASLAYSLCSLDDSVVSMRISCVLSCRKVVEMVGVDCVVE